MTIVQKAYLTYFYDYTQPSDYDSTKGLIKTEPVNLPEWFINAKSGIHRVVRILGVTANFFDPDTGLEPDDLPKGIRIYSDLTKDFLSNCYVMMINNYNCVKEFDITYNNIRKLTWWLTDAAGHIFPPVGMHIDLVVELELMLVDDS